VTAGAATTHPNAPVWDRAAAGYARQEHLERQAIARALDLAAIDAADRVLDVATGTGVVLRALAARPHRPEQAEGVDASAGMLARVGPLPAGWTTRQADARQLPLADASVDVVLAAYVLQVLETHDRRAVLAEVARVLVPGGRLVTVTTWSARRPARTALAGLAALAPRSLVGLTPRDPRAEVAAAGLTLERAALLRHGYPSLVLLARHPRAAA
jgi:ubiquinone/menaquinone biosynthesis C-methylase UbiE